MYDPLPETYSEGLRNLIASMLSKDVIKRPSANDLLQVTRNTCHVPCTSSISQLHCHTDKSSCGPHVALKHTSPFTPQIAFTPRLDS